MSIRNIILTIFCLGIICIGLLLQAPKKFPTSKTIFHIEKGTGLSVIASNLYERHYIKWPLAFKVLAKGVSLGKGVQAGDYVFYEQENVLTVAYRLITGDQGQARIKVTIPEGTKVSDMAYIYLKNIPNFNAPRFVGLAKKDEGYLYPDTYYFLETVSADEVVKTMKETFNQKIKSLEKEIKDFKKPLSDIIIMASIVEKEAHRLEDRKIIAGILWKRIEKGMLLQVDPPFYYISEKTNNVTYNDLKIESPYNTYKYKGLPPGPIGSPSLDSITATLRPTTTKYYFYLSGRDGKMRYGITYENHLLNISQYLR